ncbi:MAG TPA: exopolysaccharide biosynthesis polyprenyl glycosylphosphotransferase [Nocardioides sp.]|nr:exopolysaccharide biosynthesis polyprenyl glycosylphosphotransferase [Nocardioides sp.]
MDVVLAVAVALTASVVVGTEADATLLAAVAWPLLLLARGHYDARAMRENAGPRALRVLWDGARAAVLAVALSPWSTSVDLLDSAQLFAVLGVVSGAWALLGVGLPPSRLVLAGRPRDVREAMRELQHARGHEVVAVCLTRQPRDPFVDVPTYLGFEESSDVARRHHADTLVVLPGARLTASEVRRLHWALDGVGTELCVGTGLIDVAPGRARVVASAGLNLVRVVPAPLRGPRRWAKEVIERLASTAGLVLLLPLLGLLCLAIRLDSPGPALYRQVRVGRDGRSFTMYKLRSMVSSAEAERQGLTDANEADGVLFKMHQDPRITGLGRWLRKYSLDELPQLWNVVRGDMSLVGPRPALPDEVARYDVDPRRRLVVKPGCTGLWQVSGRSDLTWEQSVRLDLRYVDNWSLRLDLAILLRTVSAVLTHRGAY